MSLINQFFDTIRVPAQYEGVVLEILEDIYNGNYNMVSEKFQQYYIPNHPTLISIKKIYSTHLGNKSSDFLISSNIDNVKLLEILKISIKCISLEYKAIDKQDKSAVKEIKIALEQLFSLIERDKWIERLKTLELRKDRIERFWILLLGKYIVYFPKDDLDHDKMLRELNYLKKGQELEQDRPNLSITYRKLGNRWYFSGNIKRASEYFMKALDIAQDVGLRIQTFGLLNNVGVIKRNQGEYDKALNYYQRALELTGFEELKKFQGIVKNNIGAIYFYKNELEQAAEYYKDALDAYQHNGTQKQIASAIDNVGEVFYHLGKYDKAIKFYQDGLDIREQIDIKQDIATSVDNLGDIYRDKGNLGIALSYYERAYVLRQSTDNLKLITKSYQKLAKIHQMKGELDQAEVYLYKIPPIIKKFGNIQELIFSWFDILLFTFETIEENEAQLTTIASTIIELSNQLKPTQFVKQISHVVTLTRLLGTLQKPRQKFKFFVLKQLKDLVDEIDYDFNLQYYVYLRIIDLLIFEVNTFYEEETRDELAKIITEIKYKAQEQYVLPKLYKLGLLEAEVALLELDIERVEQILKRYLLETEERGLMLINSQLNHFYLDFIRNKDKFTKLIKGNADLKNILRNSTITSTIDNLISGVEQNFEDENIVPKMFLLIDLNSGNTIHSNTLDPTFTLNETLIGALISAINSFMEEAFTTKSGLHRIEYGGNTVLISQERNILFCYLFSGSDRTTLPKLLKFKDEIIESEVWTELLEFKFKIDHQLNARITKLVEQYLI